MHPTELFDELKKQYELSSDSELADLVGLTPSRISQIRKGESNLTVRQLASYMRKAEERGRKQAFSSAIRPIVEMYPIEVVSSKQDKKWELLSTGKDNPIQQALRKHLEESKGIYVFYDSQGCAIYAGKTERQNLWKEMTSAYNRERSNHQVLFVDHPTTGTFKPAWEAPRQPKKRAVQLFRTASYFSAFEVSPELIPNLEAFIIRSFCNSLSNKKMERFTSTN